MIDRDLRAWRAYHKSTKAMILAFIIAGVVSAIALTVVWIVGQ